ncbi:hypothetical protein QWZ03_01710 [Chitinimonas viridis]|uniref:Uncharacterized protein n=1 Tax=Chitinimonas viridis TaxID=664880 RepID=A0ABT8B1A8_9NEIS|nr:hypothetical protein [Chitinimonas viridis]MDN3575486.1 hypothetical protein [Chitinimonas viridis]
MDTTLYPAQAIMGGAVPPAVIATIHRISHTSRADDQMASVSALILNTTTQRTQLLQNLIHRLMTAPHRLPTTHVDRVALAPVRHRASYQMADLRSASQASAAHQQNGRYAASGLHKQAASKHEAAAQLHREAAALHEAAQPIEARAAADRALSSSAQAHLTSAAAE